MQPRSVQFRKEREAQWRELDGLVEEIERRGVRSLSADALTRLPVLYRAALSSLSVARAISLDRNLVEYLDGLCSRAYVRVYGPKQGVGATLREFLGRAFPVAVRRFRWHVALAALFLLLGGAAGFVLTLEDTDRYHAFVPEGLAGGRGPATPTEELRSGLYAGGENDASQLGFFASFLFSHNARIGFLAFALGFAAGIPVILLIFQNGLTLGAFAALYETRGLSPDLWAWLLPHGVTELLAVVLCGAAGLEIGRAVVFPGRRTRRESVARAGLAVGPIVLGTVLLFLVAGLIEGIFRQTVHDMGIRYSVAAGTALLWIGYFTLGGRRRS